MFGAQGLSNLSRVARSNQSSLFPEEPDAALPGAADELFAVARRVSTPADIAARLGLAPATVAKWEAEGRPPPAYEDDLRRITGRPPGPGREEDRYYTKPEVARLCLDLFAEKTAAAGADLGKYVFVEPAAGDGAFYGLLPPSRRIGIDLAPGGPLRAEMIKTDFLRWRPPPGNYLAVGNPPFGLRGHLALLFLNRCALFADAIGFILPQLFASDGKGAPRKRAAGCQLLHTAALPDRSFVRPDGAEADISAVFQVWAGAALAPETAESPPSCRTYLDIYSVSDGGTPDTTRTRDKIGLCALYLPSTCYRGMRVYRDFEDLPERRGYGVIVKKERAGVIAALVGADWEAAAFRSTNGALNLRRSLIAEVAVRAGFTDPSPNPWRAGG